MSGLTIIVAMDARRGIGIDNKLPWHLSEDLIRFKQITTGHAIIMGRKTYESIGKPLPNRRNIVLTRQADWQAAGIEVAQSLTDAMQLVRNDEAFVIGGAEIYSQALPYCSKLLVTEIHHDVHCDAFFPAIDHKAWQEVERTTQHSDKNGFDYSFVTYQKM
ncbi:dihydrofolate reductase [Oxalobacteraceae bacterium GrIS 2.11]